MTVRTFERQIDISKYINPRSGFIQIGGTYKLGLQIQKYKSKLIVEILLGRVTSSKRLAIDVNNGLLSEIQN